MTWFKGQAADFYDSGIQMLVPRLNKCLDSAGDYVEKSSYIQAIHSQCRFCKLKCCTCLRPLYLYFPNMPGILHFMCIKLIFVIYKSTLLPLMANYIYVVFPVVYIFLHISA